MDVFGRYCERFLELMIDLEALLPTRRFFNAVMDDCHLVVRCQLSSLLQRPEGGLFGQVSPSYLYGFHDKTEQTAYLTYLNSTTFRHVF